MDLGHRSGIALIFVLVAAGCALQSDPGSHVDARGPRVDANPECTTNPTLTIGTCRVQNTGAPCSGVADENSEFVPVATGAPIKMVIGPQGSTMFVLGIQTSGIEPGDPMDVVSPDNPSISITLFHAAGTEMALYRGRSAFTEAAPMLEANGLFVVVDGRPGELAGENVTAHANVTDKNGDSRCGVLTFVAQQ